MKKEIKEYLDTFEEVSDIKLQPQSTVVIRVEGKDFSKVTKTLIKPFDDLFSAVMENTMHQVASSIEGCFYAYTESDEITFLLENHRGQDPYLDNNIQKMSSIVASRTTLIFYRNVLSLVMEYQDIASKINNDNLNDDQAKEYSSIMARINNIWEVLEADIVFSAKCFTIPEDEMWNEIYYRQQKCYEDAVESMCSAYLTEDTFKNKKLNAKLKLLEEAGHPISEIDDRYKFGIEYGKDEEGDFITQAAVKLEYDDIR